MSGNRAQRLRRALRLRRSARPQHHAAKVLPGELHRPRRQALAHAGRRHAAAGLAEGRRHQRRDVRVLEAGIPPGGQGAVRDLDVAGRAAQQHPCPLGDLEQHGLDIDGRAADHSQHVRRRRLLRARRVPFAPQRVVLGAEAVMGRLATLG